MIATMRGPLFVYSRYSPRGRRRGGGRFEHPRLVEVLPKLLTVVAFFDTRSKSSGIFYYPIPAGGDHCGGDKQEPTDTDVT